MARTALFLSLATVAILLWIGCDKRNFIFDKSVDIPGQHWAYRDTVNFTIPIEDTVRLYNLYLRFDHTKDYPDQNIYVNIYTLFPSGKRLKKLVNFDLADPTGKWNGDCSGNSCSLEIPIQEDAFFNYPGSYTFTIEQYMRVDSLPGIEKVSMRVEDTGKNRTM